MVSILRDYTIENGAKIVKGHEYSIIKSHIDNNLLIFATEEMINSYL